MNQDVFERPDGARPVKAFFRAYVAFLFGLCLTVLPAQAQEKTRDFAYELHWIVGEATLPAGSMWIKEQKEMVRAYLRPIKLFVATAEIRSADGQLLVPAGTQLAGLSGKFRGACSLHKSDRRDAVASKKRICVLDTTGNGTFDSWFANGAGGSMWFVLEGKEYPQMGKLADIALNEIDTAGFSDPPIFRVRYERILDAGNAFQKVLDGRGIFSSDRQIGTRIRFYMEVGDDDYSYIYGNLCAGTGRQDLCVNGDAPSEGSIFGLSVSVLERKKEDLNIRINSSFDPVEIGFTPDDNDSYSITGDYYVVGGLP